jgi:cytidylate kinase
LDAQQRKINIAIDGPAGAGKSTVARLVAKALGYVYVDTGAMYRVITWKAIQAGLSLGPDHQIVRLARETDIKLIPGESGQHVLADGEDVTENIRTTAVNNTVSAISQIKEIREILSLRQKEMAAAKGVVMDGRDIGTHVLPDAELKVFLTASVEQRAGRRHRELQQSNQNISLEQLKQDIALRDRTDEQREVSPLRMADDAIFLDSTNMSVSQVVDRILDLSRTITDGAK